MKRTFITLMMGVFLCNIPVLLSAQFVTDYRPAGSPSVSSQLNLVSVVETFGALSGQSRAVNTILEAAGAAASDVWVTSVSNTGIVSLSNRYGVMGAIEVAAAIVRCPNNDFIIAANIVNTAAASNAIWLFRINNAGAIIWSNRYGSTAANGVKAYCIKQSQEVPERYIVSGTANNDSNLVAFKIDAAGTLIWNFRYIIPTPVVRNIPKSMISLTTGVVIAGNRIAGNSRDIFTIGLNQFNGAINLLYRSLDNGGRQETDPFINTGNGGELVLTYTVPVAIGGVTDNRMAFNRLIAATTQVVGATNIFWETGAIRSFTHTIYPNTGGTGYDIGGGSFVGNFLNPLFFSVNNVGGFIAASHRRLWPGVSFNSTFMMRDAFTAVNRYEHHNFKTTAGQNSMSLLRDNSVCFISTPLNSTAISAVQTVFTYTQTPLLTAGIYTPTITPVGGIFVPCAGGAGGIFRQGNEGAFGDNPIETKAAFKLYPNIVRSNALVNMQFTAPASGEVTIHVFNLQSQLVLSRKETSRKGVNTFGLDTRSLGTGTYIVQVISGGESWQSKLVKE
jgi:Secretion system C-terminal sorting domain